MARDRDDRDDDLTPRTSRAASGLTPSRSDFAGKKTAAGICGILLGSLGVHKFILGLTTPGIIMLLVSVLTCGFGTIIMGPIGLIEGILYLTKKDDEFYEQYAIDKKGWF